MKVKLPRGASALIACSDDPAWHGRLLAAARAVGRIADTPREAAYALIAERKARQGKPTAALQLATVRALNVAINDQFWRDVDDAVAAYDSFRAELAARLSASVPVS